MKNACRAIVAAGIAAGFGAASAQAETVFVTSSSGPGAVADYPRGRRLDPDHRFILREGDAVVVLTAHGSRRFRGPGQFRIDDERQRSRLTWANRRQIARVAVARARPGPRTADFRIVSDRGGIFCLWDGVTAASFDLVAPSELTPSDRETRYIYDDRDRPLASFDFSESRSVPWPETAWPADGGEFAIGRSPSDIRARVAFIDLGEIDPDTPIDEAAARLIEHGCHDQLEQLTGSATGGR